MKTSILAALLLCCATTASAKVKLSSLIADNMVMQQQTDVRLWGTATAGATVSATPTWDGKTATAVADTHGNWLLTLKTPAGGFTPYEITIGDGNPAEDVTVRNVLVGEVWLASGQSNMQMPIKGFAGCCIEGGIEEALQAPEVKGVRMFNVPMRQAYTPIENCGGAWKTTECYKDVMEFSATAWHFAKQLHRALRLPVGIVNCSYGGTCVESWLPKEVLKQYPGLPTDSAAISRHEPGYERPMLTYNGMFRAVRHYTVKGIVWYQGCSNVGTYQTYADRLADMVSLWREEMALGDIPFYFVEIAPYDYGSGEGLEQKGALLREQQQRARKLIANSAMVSTNNLVEPYERFNIHPARKAEVGTRLCLLALNKTYGHRDLCCEGPEYKSWTVKGSEAWVAFDNLQMGICRNYDLQGFELAGEDKVFHPAESATLHWQTNEIVLKSSKVKKPVAVRYCFRDFQPGTLYGGNWLPALPFRTDNW